MRSILSYLSIICLIFAVGCERKHHISIGTAPAGGAFFVVGSAIAEVVDGNTPEAGWELRVENPDGTQENILRPVGVTAESTKGTQENIRRLVSGELEFALANAAISYFAVRGEGAWETEHAIRTVMTLAPNVGLFITPQSSGIQTIQDFAGKRIVVGPAGAGFEYFLKPILAAHGVTYEDFTPLNSHYIGAVDLLADGSAAAAFMGGAIPTPAVTQASTSQDIFFIPFDAAAKQSLFQAYPFFNAITIPADTYKGQTEPFASMNVGAMHLITAEHTDENMVYEFTKTLYTHRAEVVKRHGAGKAINPKNVVKDTGTPFHPGAIRFYREIGIWSE
jgi:TRAP transporter TAXI family solute receptor